MAYNGSDNSGEGRSGNVWSSGSRGGSRGGYSRSNNDDDDSGSRGGGSYRGSFGNNNSRRGGSGGGGGGSGGGGGYGFRRQNAGEVEVLRDAIFIQNLPKNITRDEILDAFSTVGPIKTDEQSGSPKIWIYKDRDTGEGIGRATVTYEDDETANKAIAEYNDQHIDSIDSTVRVQLAQRRARNTNNDRGYRGGRSSWDDGNSRQGFNSNSSRWGNSRGGFSDSRGGGGGGGFRGAGSGGGGGGGDRGDSYRGNRDGGYRGASRGTSGSSNYSPY